MSTIFFKKNSTLLLNFYLKLYSDIMGINPIKKNEGIPLSQKIRERLKSSGTRFFATDNISDHLEPNEQNALIPEIEQICTNLLNSLVIDVENDPNTKDTARRMAKMFIQEIFSGRYVKPPTITEFPNSGMLEELMLVGPLTVRSACSHHFCPILGRIWLGVIPNKNSNVLGLSKYSRIVEWIMARPQIQEEAITQLADFIEEKSHPDGLAVVMQATHFCMSWRGVREADGLMTNILMRGLFKTNQSLRMEFLSLLPKR
jgi:GTP cyclohydrolase IA